jgi:hypothetical protein
MFLVSKRRGIKILISGASDNGTPNQTMSITVADATCEEIKALILEAIGARTKKEVNEGKYNGTGQED